MRGRALRSGRVVVYVAPAPEEPAPPTPRAAMVAGRKVGGAVARNRARRILREAWRRVGPRVREGYHVVLVALPRIHGAKADDLAEEVRGTLAEAGMLR